MSSKKKDRQEIERFHQSRYIEKYFWQDPDRSWQQLDYAISLCNYVKRSSRVGEGGFEFFGFCNICGYDFTARNRESSYVATHETEDMSAKYKPFLRKTNLFFATQYTLKSKSNQWICQLILFMENRCVHHGPFRSKVNEGKMLSLQVFFCYCYLSEVMIVNPLKQCPGSSLTF